MAASLSSKIEREILVTQERLKGVDDNLKRLKGRDNNTQMRSERHPRMMDNDIDEPPPKRRSISGGVFARLGGLSVRDRDTRRLSGGASRRESLDGLDERQARGWGGRRGGRIDRGLQPMDEEEDFEETEQFTPKPSVASSVARSGGEKSRDEAAAAVGTDRDSIARHRRMFGALLGTLRSFKKDEAKQKDKEEQRQAVEKKLEERGLIEKEEMRAERRRLFEEKKEKEIRIRRLADHAERVKEHEQWSEYQLQLCSFIKTTNSSPPIFWLPKLSNRASDKLLKATNAAITSQIAQKKEDLEQELQELMRPRTMDEDVRRTSSRPINDYVDSGDDEGDLEYDEAGELDWRDRDRGKETIVVKKTSIRKRLSPSPETVEVVKRKGKKVKDDLGLSGATMLVRVSGKEVSDGGSVRARRVVEVAEESVKKSAEEGKKKKKLLLAAEDMKDITIKVERAKDGVEEKENRKIVLEKTSPQSKSHSDKHKKKAKLNKPDSDLEDEVTRMRRRIVEKARKINEEKKRKASANDDLHDNDANENKKRKTDVENGDVFHEENNKTTNTENSLPPSEEPVQKDAEDSSEGLINKPDSESKSSEESQTQKETDTCVDGNKESQEDELDSVQLMVDPLEELLMQGDEPQETVTSVEKPNDKHTSKKTNTKNKSNKESTSSNSETSGKKADKVTSQPEKEADETKSLTEKLNKTDKKEAGKKEQEKQSSSKPEKITKGTKSDKVDEEKSKKVESKPNSRSPSSQSKEILSKSDKRTDESSKQASQSKTSRTDEKKSDKINASPGVDQKLEIDQIQKHKEKEDSKKSDSSNKPKSAESKKQTSSEKKSSDTASIKKKVGNENADRSDDKKKESDAHIVGKEQSKHKTDASLKTSSKTSNAEKSMADTSKKTNLDKSKKSEKEPALQQKSSEKSPKKKSSLQKSLQKASPESKKQRDSHRRSEQPKRKTRKNDSDESSSDDDDSSSSSNSSSSDTEDSHDSSSSESSDSSSDSSSSDNSGSDSGVDSKKKKKGRIERSHQRSPDVDSDDNEEEEENRMRNPPQKRGHSDRKTKDDRSKDSARKRRR